MENVNDILKNVPAINVKEENGQQLVSARELYKGLELKKRFSSWVETNFSEFTEEEDFTSVLSSTVVNNGGTKAIQDFLITVDMAKQLCLMSRTEKGKIYRRYFIEIERRWNDPQEVIKRGYAYLQNQNLKLTIENKDLHKQNNLLAADNEKMIPLTDGEAMMLKQVASKKAARLVKTILYRRFGNSDYGGHEFFNAKYGHVIRTVYSLLKHEFNVIKYTAILHVQFQDALDFANQITVDSLPAKATRLTDKQVEKLNEWEERHGLSLTPKED